MHTDAMCVFRIVRNGFLFTHELTTNGSESNWKFLGCAEIALMGRFSSGSDSEHQYVGWFRNKKLQTRQKNMYNCNKSLITVFTSSIKCFKQQLVTQYIKM